MLMLLSAPGLYLENVDQGRIVIADVNEGFAERKPFLISPSYQGAVRVITQHGPNGYSLLEKRPSGISMSAAPTDSISC